MNAVMEIRINVAQRQAQQALQQVSGDLDKVKRAGTGAGGGIGKFQEKIGGALKGMENFGKNLQWVGRQIEYSITLPLVAAGTAAYKMSMDNERAMTSVRKVYGDTTQDAAKLDAELDALQESFSLLSSRYGVQQSEVIKIGQAWAQAGAEGAAVANATRNSLDFMILSMMDAEEATSALIAMQSVYRFSTEEMTLAMAQLNVVENNTAAKMSDLIQVIQKTGAAARSTGIEVRELAAMTAALVPATGSASVAGNALKTIISRLFAPTTQAQDALRAIGVEIEGVAWQSATGTERVEQLAEAFKDLSPAQEALVASVIGSRRQYNTLQQLMNDVASGTGRYHRALEVTNDETEVMNQYHAELQRVLESHPKKMDIMTQTMKNAVADAFVPMLPVLTGIIAEINKLVQWFTNLDEGTQKNIIMFLAMLAVLGPLVRTIGALILVIKTFFSTMNVVFLKGIPKAIAKLKLLGATLEGLSASFAKLRASQFVSDIGATLGPMLRTAVSAWAEMVAGIWRTLTLNIQVAWKMTLQWLGVQWTMLWVNLKVVSQSAMAAISSAMRAVWFATSQVLIGIWMAMKAAMAAISTAFAFLVANIKVVAIVAAVAVAIAAIVALFRSDLGQGIMDSLDSITRRITDWLDGLGRGFGNAIGAVIGFFAQMPVAVGRVMQRTAEIVADAMRQIAEMLSYLNPFARHSPSLVEQVESGMDRIVSKYVSGVGRITHHLRRAAAAHRAFLDATGGEVAFEQRRFARDRETVAEQMPGALPNFDRVVGEIIRLKRVAIPLEQAIKRQELVVKAWQHQLDIVNSRLEHQEQILRALQDRSRAIEQAISDANAQIARFASAHLPGMRRMSDQIFANEMAQKRLRLEIMRLEEAGHTVDDLRDRLARLEGEIHGLRGKRAELRLAGAGSDVLGPIDEQIALLEKQRDTLQQSSSPIEKMQDELDKLQRKGEMLRLEESIRFDPQLRQIDQLANGIEELPFHAIVNGIRAGQAEIRRLEKEQKAVNRAIEAQEAAVEQVVRARDRMQASYDREREHLEALKDAYAAINDQISEMESTLSSFVQMAQDAAKEAEKKGKEDKFGDMFDAAAAGDFEIPGGDFTLGREGGLAEIEDFNEQLAAELAEIMNEFDIFGTFRDWGRKLSLIWGTVTGFVAGVWNLLKGPIVFFSGGWVFKLFDTLKSAVGGALDWLGDRFRGLDVGRMISASFSGAIPFLSSFWGGSGVGGTGFAGMANAGIAAVTGAFGNWNFMGLIRGAFSGAREFVRAQWDHFRALPSEAIGFVTGLVSGWNIAGVVGSVLGRVVSVASTLWNRFMALPGQAVGFITGLVSRWNIGGIVGSVLGGAMNVASTLWNRFMVLPNQAVGFITGLVSRWNIGGIVGGVLSGAMGVASRLWDSFTGYPRRALDAVISAVRSWPVVRHIEGAISKAVDVVRGLPSTLRGLASDARTWLFDAGKRVIEGLANGMKAAIPGPLAGAMDTAASMARSFWPFSPAKRGPLSGAGSLDRAGYRMIRDLARGVEEGTIAELEPELERSARRVSSMTSDDEVRMNLMRSGFKLMQSFAEGVTDGSFGELSPAFVRAGEIVSQGLGSIDRDVDGAYQIPTKLSSVLGRTGDALDGFARRYAALQQEQSRINGMWASSIQGAANTAEGALSGWADGGQKSLQDVTAGLHASTEEHRNWQQNLWYLSRFVSEEFAAEMSKLTPAQAAEAARLAREAPEQLQPFIDAMTENARVAASAPNDPSVMAEMDAAWAAFTNEGKPKARSAGINFAQESTNALSSGWTSNRPGVSRVIQSVLRDVSYAATPSATSAARSVGQSMMGTHGASGGIRGQRGQLGSTASGIFMGAIGDARRPAESSASGVGSAMTNATRLAMLLGQGRMTGASRAIMLATTAAANVIAANNSASTGSAMIWGIQRGMNNNVAALYANAARIALEVVSRMRRVLGISSPSKIMDKLVGMPIGQGIAAGITRSRAFVQRALDGLLGSLRGTASIDANVQTHAQRAIITSRAARTVHGDNFRPMRAGGTIIKRSRGGVPLIVGEGSKDERIQVLPLRGGESEGGNITHIHINGNLEFPNIENGDDAEEFVDNLASLGGR